MRAARPGEGTALAALWRELWDAHEQWGGYPASHDARVYAQVAAKLDQDARARAGHALLGRHAHFVADFGAGPCGQVEGWLDRLGASNASPITCEVRSLIVGGAARHRGAGRALLDALARVTQEAANGSSCVLAAEVLEPNPAREFYSRVGYAVVSWAARLEAPPGAIPRGSAVTARMAMPHDALAIARLEAVLAERRHAAGDARYDPPSAVDATVASTIAAQMAAQSATRGRHAPERSSATVVAVDGAGVVRGVASAAVQLLEPPFLPIRRALIGRFALDPACRARPVVQAIVAWGCRWAASQGAHYAELTDLSAPGTELYDAALAIGARPWSRLVIRVID
ncbi:MAG TPA: GNAT family N-acetyltransferase [Polyangiaceae bacterium]|nr:GNAT family N-acetyltransferase [Polyangiaceae bacterium]